MSNDDLYFSFDDEEEGEPGAAGEGTPEAEESQNRTFLYATIGLGAIFVLGLILIAFLLLRGKPNQQAAASANEMTNQANQALFAATQTADFQTQSAPTPLPPTDTPVPATVPPQPSATPTSIVQVTAVTPTPGETTVAEVTPGTPGAETPTALVEVTAEPTSGLIEVTPLGGGGGPTAEGGTGVPTGVGGPIGASVTPTETLPQTGFAGGVGLAGAGLAALALVAIVVITRRTRLK